MLEEISVPLWYGRRTTWGRQLYTDRPLASEGTEFRLQRRTIGQRREEGSVPQKRDAFSKQSCGDVFKVGWRKRQYDRYRGRNGREWEKKRERIGAGAYIGRKGNNSSRKNEMLTNRRREWRIQVDMNMKQEYPICLRQWCLKQQVEIVMRLYFGLGHVLVMLIHIVHKVFVIVFGSVEFMTVVEGETN